MAEYNKANVKLSYSQLNKLQPAFRNQKGATLRMNIKIFEKNNLPHDFFGNKTKNKKTKFKLVAF